MTDQINIPAYSNNQYMSPEKIIRVQSLDNYSKIYFINARPLVVSKVLLWFEDRLPKEMFIRVHRSHIVNKNHVIKIRGLHGNMLLLSNGENIMISRRKKTGVVKGLQASLRS